MDNSSLAKHIKYRLQVVASRGSNWVPANQHELDEHILTQRSRGPRLRMETWEPEVTAGTIDEEHNRV